MISALLRLCERKYLFKQRRSIELIRSIHQPETQLRNIRDKNERDEQNEDERQRGDSHFPDRFLEPETRHEQIESHRRQKIRDLKIRQEDDAEMDRIDAVLFCHGNDERNNDDGGEDLHHHSNDEEEDIQDDQEEDLAAHHLADILE